MVENRPRRGGWRCAISTFVLGLLLVAPAVAQSFLPDQPVVAPVFDFFQPPRLPPVLTKTLSAARTGELDVLSLIQRPQWLDEGLPFQTAQMRPEQALGTPIGLGSAGPNLEEPNRDMGAPLSDDKLRPTVNLTVQLQSDFAWFDQTEANRQAVGNIPDGAFFRRARMGVMGDLYKNIEYRIEFDFAGEARPQFLDLWIAMTNLPLQQNIIVGHFFEPFSLERYTPNRFITFNERALVDSLSPARNMGAMLYGHTENERITWAVGAFRTRSDDYGDHVSNQGGWAITAHSTILPWYLESDEYTLYMLHLGASYSYRAGDDDPLRFRSRPSIRMNQQGVGGVPNFVDTGDILNSENYRLYGLEAAWVHGPFSVQGEWIAASVPLGPESPPFFHGAYIYASWFLTGESRSYSRTNILGRFREGIFQRVIPRSNVWDRRSEGINGPGAWEVAARWSYLNLNSAGIQGGYLEDWTLGVNWYLNPYTRISANYVHPILHDNQNRKSTAGMYSLRFQFEY
jgi:phosphate-selective porin OprO/OprP